jgi:hypothetical protein
VFAKYNYTIFQLLIADPTNPRTGFTLCRDWTESQGKDFPFCNPRQLFVQICRDQANSGWEISLEGGSSKEEIKKSLRRRKQLFKHRLKEEEQVLKSWSGENWSLAWIPAIYPVIYSEIYRGTKEPLREYWHKLDEAHDLLVEFICRKPSRHARKDVALIFPGRDRGGRAINPETKQRLFW